jgi:hypothetical protein
MRLYPAAIFVSLSKARVINLPYDFDYPSLPLTATYECLQIRTVP